MELFPQTRHLAIGKSMLIVCLLFSITIIGESPTAIPPCQDILPKVDSMRLKNVLILDRLQTKLNQYELKKCDNK